MDDNQSVLRALGLVVLNFDRDDLLDRDRTDDLGYQGPAQQVAADGVGEQHHDVVIVQLQHDEEQYRWQSQQHGTAHAAFSGQRLDLSEDMQTFTDQVSDLVQDFGQVTTGLSLQNDGGRKEAQGPSWESDWPFLRSPLPTESRSFVLQSSGRILSLVAVPFRWRPVRTRHSASDRRAAIGSVVPMLPAVACRISPSRRFRFIINQPNGSEANIDPRSAPE